jgi:hypothetical protein
VSHRKELAFHATLIQVFTAGGKSPYGPAAER